MGVVIECHSRQANDAVALNEAFSANKITIIIII